MGNRPTSIIIVGLEHSGTTLLDTLLSCHPQVVGLGEVLQVLDDGFRNSYYKRWGSYSDVDQCSCGKRHAECPVWGNTLRSIEDHPGESLASRFARLLEQVDEFDFVVDSSKHLEAVDLHLDALDQGLLKEVKILWVYKDPRSFVASQCRKRGRSPLSIYRSLNWWVGAQDKILRKLRSGGNDVALFKYEELCFNTRGAIQALEKFLGIEFDEFVKSGQMFGSKNSHVAVGNKDMVNNSNSYIRYDARWMNDHRLQWMFLLHRNAKHMLARMDFIREGKTNFQDISECPR